jgi:photosystem II stability/assembly factor-like uncharacterized protein
LESGTIRGLCNSPASPGLLFALQYSKLFRSTDDGQTWAPVEVGENLESLRALVILPEAPDRLLALTQTRGVYAITLP